MDFGKLFSKLVDVVKENIETAAAKPASQPSAQPKPTPQPATPHYEEEIVRTDSEWLAYFREILATAFPQYTVRENVPVTDIAGFANDEFQLYKTRPPRKPASLTSTSTRRCPTNATTSSGASVSS